jgi:signal transduction histidine kinase
MPLSRLELKRARSNAQALAGQEADRHRIAQELHDGIGQGLTVVLLGPYVPSTLLRTNLLRSCGCSRRRPGRA